LVASADVANRKAFLRGLSGPQLKALPYLFEFWALDHQLAPEGDWRTWIILGGRGAGKTRAGAEWVRSMVEGSRPRDPSMARHVGLIGETMEQAREVMVFGASGILACSPPDRRPQWISGRNLLVWPNGAEARLYSAFDPERLRGPQFDAVWADELAKWPKAQNTWDMMQFCAARQSS
jgi:phage terminase large subunit-like protein